MVMSCYEPSNPDVTGIGVRVSSYATFFATHILWSMYGFDHPKRPLFIGMRRLRTFTLLSTIISTAIMKSKNQISVFHTIAANQLAFLNFITSVTEASRLMPIMFYNSEKYKEAAMKEPEARSRAMHAFFDTCLFGIYSMFMTRSLVTGDTTCTISGSAENGFTDILWVFLFRFHIRKNSSFCASELNFVLYCLLRAGLYVILLLSKRTRFGTAIPCSFFVGIQVIIGIEESLRVNVGLDRRSEDQMGYGQISALILTLACIGDPIFEIWDPDGKRSKKLEEESKREEDESNRQSSASGISKFHVDTSSSCSDDTVCSTGTQDSGDKFLPIEEADSDISDSIEIVITDFGRL